MNRLNMNSFYRNAPIKKCFCLLAIHKKIKIQLITSDKRLIDVCRHVTKMACFKSNNGFYKQKSSLP